MIIAYTIISKDVGLLNWCVTNARDRAGIDHEWLIVGWDATDDVKDWCSDNRITLANFEPTEAQYHPDKTSWFLHNLYKGWNLGYEACPEAKWTVRMGSDQFFSKNWLKNLMESADRHGENSVYHTWTVESDIAKNSRHEIRSWGHTWDTFEFRRFDVYANDLIHRMNNEHGIDGDRCDLWYRHPVRGKQRRPDGVTWLQTRDLWVSYGPLQSTINAEGVTGDVSYMDSLYDNGVTGYLCPRSISYHLVRGESRDIQTPK